MLKSKFILLGVMGMFLGGTMYAMENDNLVLIKNSNEIARFAGAVVAYTTPVSTFTFEDGRYVVPRSNFFYGYVNSEVHEWKGREDIYYLSLLLKNNKHSDNRPLANQHIKRGNLYMRKVTPEEAASIVDALYLGKARFSKQGDNGTELLISKLEEIAQ